MISIGRSNLSCDSQYSASKSAKSDWEESSSPLKKQRITSQDSSSSRVSKVEITLARCQLLGKASSSGFKVNARKRARGDGHPSTPSESTSNPTRRRFLQRAPNKDKSPSEIKSKILAISPVKSPDSVKNIRLSTSKNIKGTVLFPEEKPSKTLTGQAYDLKSLTTEAVGLWNEITREGREFTFAFAKKEKEIGMAFKGYLLALDTNLPLLLLGGAEMRDDLALQTNFGVLATKPQCNEKMIREIFKKVHPPKENANQSVKEVVKSHVTRGSIINESNWWIFRNDMFILGAIHGKREFHIARPKGNRPSEEMLWDAKTNRPRALGRELIMLKAAGYQRIDSPAREDYQEISSLRKVIGMVFAPPVEGPKILTLTEAREAIKQVKSVKDIQEIFSKKYSNDCARELL